MHTVHTHWDYTQTDCDGTYVAADVFDVTGDTVGEVLARVVADQYHACERIHGGQALGRYCDEYEHARTLHIQPDGTVATHGGLPYVQGWTVETTVPTEEGGVHESFHIHAARCARTSTYRS